MFAFWEDVETSKENVGNQPSEEIIITYVSLLQIYEDTKLTNRQREIMELFKDRNTELEIANELNISKQAVNGIIKSACEKISNEHHMQWLDIIYKNKLNLISKKCQSCEKNYSAIDELNNICKKCMTPWQIRLWGDLLYERSFNKLWLQQNTVIKN